MRHTHCDSEKVSWGENTKVFSGLISYSSWSEERGESEARIKWQLTFHVTTVPSLFHENVLSSICSTVTSLCVISSFTFLSLSRFVWILSSSCLFVYLKGWLFNSLISCPVDSFILTESTSGGNLCVMSTYINLHQDGRILWCHLIFTEVNEKLNKSLHTMQVSMCVSYLLDKTLSIVTQSFYFTCFSFSFHWNCCECHLNSNDLSKESQVK